MEINHDNLVNMRNGGSRAAERGFGTPSNGGPGKHLYCRTARLAVSCRGAWTERDYLYSEQIAILLRGIETCTLSVQ
jgi:hypothetical protein